MSADVKDNYFIHLQMSLDKKKYDLTSHTHADGQTALT